MKQDEKICINQLNGKRCPRPIQIAQSQLCADSALPINFRAKDGKSKFRCQCVDASNYTPRPCQEMDPKDFGQSQTNGIYEPIWYSGLMMPTNILVGESDDEEEEEATGNESDVAAEGADYEEHSDE